MKKNPITVKFVISLLLLLSINICEPVLAQNKTRIGSLSSSSSDDACRRYFKDNLLLLDPIEGEYNSRIVVQTRFGGQSRITDDHNTELFIYKIGENEYTIRGYLQTKIQRIGDTNAYLFTYKWDGGSITRHRVILLNDGLNFLWEVEMPQAETRRLAGQFYMGERVMITRDCIKSYPTYSMYAEAIEAEKRRVQQEQSSSWSGSGFAINNGYIVTNYHVVEKAKNILVYGVKGQTNNCFQADVVATDKSSDLAIIKISDEHFTGFGTIPYAVRNRTLDVGEDVWVLGYPLTQYLGNEIKLTNGLISSKSGFQGDVTTYQISAPVQPGNSGGPLFDSRGDIVGIVNAGVPGAENVGYAIKTSYLKNLVDSYSISSSLPNSNSISSMALKDQVKKVNSFVFLIICSSNNNADTSSHFSSSNSSGAGYSRGSSSGSSNEARPRSVTSSKTKSEEPPKMIDLGLSIKWADRNLGASSSSDYGFYFAWGELSPKRGSFSWERYKFTIRDKKGGILLSKYNTNKRYGFVDNQTGLDASDDVAHFTWGGAWRMPTKAELDELRDKCTWKWTILNGVCGYKVIGPNGNSIFLPASGVWQSSGRTGFDSKGFYWSSTLNVDSPFEAFGLFFQTNNDLTLTHGERSYGAPIRPVYAE